MYRYPALIDGKKGAYGVSFPDLPGVVAMGKTIDEAMAHGEEALRDYAIETGKDGSELTPPSAMEDVEVPTGYALVPIPMILLSGRSVRANLSLDEGVAAFIDGEARRRGMTRTAYVIRGMDGPAHRANGWLDTCPSASLLTAAATSRPRT